MHPQSAEVPGRNTPICLIGGYGSGPTGYRRLLHALQDAHGQRTIWVPSLRRGGEPDHDRHASYKVLSVQARFVLEELRRLDVRKAVLVGHSMGGPIATLVADLQPQLVEHIVYLCSACLYPDAFPNLTWRMMRKVARDVWSARLLTGDDKLHWQDTRKEALRYFFANLPRSVHEGWTLGNFWVLNLLHRLDVPAYFVAGELDTLFTARKQFEHLQHAFGSRFFTGTFGHDPQLRSQDIAALMEVLVAHNLLTPRPRKD